MLHNAASFIFRGDTMKKFILIPDSFKGTLSSQDVCNTMASAIKKHLPNAEIINIPIADGGEGTVDTMLKIIGGKKKYLTIKGPYFENISSFYGILPNKTAIIEMAAAAGLPLVGNKLHAELTSTYGVGQLITDAINNGCKKILIGLGGSATNDGGCGMAAALGIKFLDKQNNEFIPVGKNLCNIYKIDNTDFLAKYSSIEFSAMCDINNPLCGKNGASYVFAPQKGANNETIQLLDEGLFHLSTIIQKDLQKQVEDIPGAGAAGGMGAGVVGFLNGKLQSGINFILDLINFSQIISDTDYVFTGEGKIDNQSIQGKVISGIAQYTKKYNIPLIAVVGCIGDNIDELYSKGITAIFSINTKPLPLSEAAIYNKHNLFLTMDNIMRIIK